MYTYIYVCIARVCTHICTCTHPNAVFTHQRAAQMIARRFATEGLFHAVLWGAGYKKTWSCLTRAPVETSQKRIEWSYPPDTNRTLPIQFNLGELSLERSEKQ